MTSLRAVVATEFLKSRRSRVPWESPPGSPSAPLIMALFMVILKDPEAARSLGLLGAKAQLTAGTADWPTYWSLLGQAVTIGGAILFAFLTAWIFGREFADRTVRGLLASATPRRTIVIAKALVIAAWGVSLNDGPIRVRVSAAAADRRTPDCSGPRSPSRASLSRKCSSAGGSPRSLPASLRHGRTPRRLPARRTGGAELRPNRRETRARRHEDQRRSSLPPLPSPRHRAGPEPRRRGRRRTHPLLGGCGAARRIPWAPASPIAVNRPAV